MNYAEARVEDTIDELAGVRLPDPYRWLEDGTAQDVRLWQKQQNELASAHVRAWPGFAALREKVVAYSTTPFGATPHRAGDKWFRTLMPDGATAASVVVADTPYGDGTVVFDPHDEGTPPPFLSWFVPSPDGKLLAVGLCADGSEQNTIRLIDLGTGDPLPAPPDRLMDNWSGGVAWLPDSAGFYVTVIKGAAIDLEQRVLFHSVADGTTTGIDLDWQTDKDYRMVVPSWDGRRLVAISGLAQPAPVAVADLDDPAHPRWQRFVTRAEAVVAGHLIGDTFFALTDLDAPRGRVVAIHLDQPEPEHWTTRLPSSDAVRRTITPVGDVLYVSEFVDTYARVRIIDRSGTAVGEVPLPGNGALGELPCPFMNLVLRGERESFVFAFSSLTSSWGVYQHKPGVDEVVELDPPAVRLTDAVVEDHWATSSDGTQVPYHVVRPADVDTTTPQPTLVYAYGGFNTPWIPQFPGPIAAFVASGGVFVHAHLRGGAEFGRDWWEGGRFRNKQNGYDDLYAIAEDLISKRRATPETLAVTGASNGGLMSGVAVTQRPDLWSAVVLRVPILDLIGACRENYGRLAIEIELADISDPDEVRRLLTFSPYHLVQEREYPAVYLDAGDTDSRCSPWHARKFAARMQFAQRGKAPTLCRIWENVGHGGATDKAIAIEQNAEWLAFVCRHLGVDGEVSR